MSTFLVKIIFVSLSLIALTACDREEAEKMLSYGECDANNSLSKDWCDKVYGSNIINATENHLDFAMRVINIEGYLQSIH